MCWGPEDDDRAEAVTSWESKSNPENKAATTGADMPQSPTEGTGIVSNTTAFSVKETVERLEALLQEKGVKLFAVVDHSGEAEACGLELRDTKLVIFGSPIAGTPVMEAAPLAALDLPLKILVWDDQGVTTVSYVTPAGVASRYGLPQELANRLTAVEVLAGALASR
jgi:uncharacterized protein (DUF302 family)